MTKRTAIKIALTMGMVALGVGQGKSEAAQIGDSTTAEVTVENRVSIPANNTMLQPTEVAHITLDCGVWLISGQINILSLNQPTGTLFTAGNIGEDISFEPTVKAAVQAERVAGLGNIIRPVAMVPRELEVEVNNTPIYLVAGVFNPNDTVTAWGFITAVKIRNYVP